jgi:hypothetical protein
MPLIPTLLSALAYLSRRCGFETVDAFPPGHEHARTHWNGAYFDVASDLKPEQIERKLCAAIANTPHIFAHITHPTPRMQRALLDVIESRLRRSCAHPADLVALLIAAYRSPRTVQVIPGLRAAIEACEEETMSERVRQVLDFLGAMPLAFDVIEAAP